MYSGVNSIAEWQRPRDSVSEAKLYNHLLRLAILAYQLEPRFNEEAQHSEPPRGHKRSMSVPMAQPKFSSKLPKGVLKALKARFRQMATEEGADASDPLRRTYLAFYAQILHAKASDPELYENMGRKAEVLILHFLSCASKETQKSISISAANTDIINHHGAKFVDLLISIIKQVKPNKDLVSQLENYKSDLVPSSSPGIPLSRSTTDLHSVVGGAQTFQLSYILEKMDLAKQVGAVMQVSGSVVQEDVQKMKDSVSIMSTKHEFAELLTNLSSGQHPIYFNKDFESNDEWQAWQDTEASAIQQILNDLNKAASTVDMVSSLRIGDNPGLSRSHILPPDPRSYFYALIKRSLSRDAKSAVILSKQSRELINTAAKFWRIPKTTMAGLLFHAATMLYRDDTAAIEILDDAFNFMEHVTDNMNQDYWPRSDLAALQEDLETLRKTILTRIIQILREIFAADVPKLGPYIGILEEHVLPRTGKIKENEIAQMRKAVFSAGEKHYDMLLAKIPRDETLDLIHIADFGDGIISTAKRLQKKYPRPLFNELSIAVLVCAREIRLFSNDFPPMFEYSVQLYEEREDSPDFTDVVALYKVVSEIKALALQVSGVEEVGIDVEQTFYPHITRWAHSSTDLAKSWIIPALEQDSFEPLDPGAGILYSSSVKDMFSTFSASLKAVEELSWNNHYQLAEILTILVQGFCEAVGIWIHKVRIGFFQELEVKTPKQAQTRQERWLALAREAVQQQAPIAPEPIHFSMQSCVQLNDVEAAYVMLNKMEETLDSDAIAKRIEMEKKAKNIKSDTPNYLYTLNIRSAMDLQPSDSKGSIDPYVTLLDEVSRRKVGRTRTAYGTTNPVWNQKFEWETSSRGQMIKLMIWDENLSSHHDLNGTTRVKLDPKDFGGKDYGTITRSLSIEQPTKSGVQKFEGSKLVVQVSMDKERADIRFYFGRALRLLKQTKQDMIELIVEQFSSFIKAYISLATIRSLLSKGKFGMNTINSWLGKSVEAKVPLTTEEVEDSLEPLFDYLNSNFRTLANYLTPEMKNEVMSQAWIVVLETIESLILPALERRKSTQTQLSATEMEIVYTWLSTLREFFHNDGAGPSLESLQSSDYQKIMAIPVYYDLSTKQLRLECDKQNKSNMRVHTMRAELMQRSGTVMAHRNRKVIEKQEAELRDAQRAAPLVDDVILRILRLRKDDEFVDNQLEFRRRIDLKRSTELALEGFR